MRDLVIEPTGFGLRGALRENGRLIDLFDIDEHGGAVTDALYLGRVRKLDRQLGAAFVDIGTGEPAFLTAKDARAGAGVGERLPIDRLLEEGQSLIVQGLREATAGKGPRVTAQLKLFGFWLILRPREQGLEVPGRLPAREAEALRSRGQALFGDAGATLRRSAAGADDAALRTERELLEQRWASLQREAAAARRPGRLGDEPLLERLLRRALEFRPTGVAVADAALAAATQRLTETRLAGLSLRIERLASTESAFDALGVDAAIDEALQPDVVLAGGGRLRIEATAACVTIDVDGGGRAALDADLAATAEIARQVRLRNLGGTIVIDFIDLPTRPQRQRLEEALKRAFRDDPLGVSLYPMSPLGLVQLSRPRRGASLADRLQRRCPACAGTGAASSLRAVAESVIHEARLGGRRRLRAAGDLAAYLQGEAASAWQAVAGRPAVEVDKALPPGAWRLE